MLSSAPRSLRLLVQLLLLVLVVGAALLYAPPVGAVSAKTLKRSLERQADGSTQSGGACRNRREGVWRCFVTKADGSGGTEYELTRRGRRCFDAVQVTPGSAPNLPTQVSGCILLRDQVRISDWF